MAPMCQPVRCCAELMKRFIARSGRVATESVHTKAAFSRAPPAAPHDQSGSSGIEYAIRPRRADIGRDGGRGAWTLAFLFQPRLQGVDRFSPIPVAVTGADPARTSSFCYLPRSPSLMWPKQQVSQTQRTSRACSGSSQATPSAWRKDRIQRLWLASSRLSAPLGI